MGSSKRLVARGALLALVGGVMALAVLGCGDDDPTDTEERTCYGIRFDEYVPTDEEGTITGPGGEDQWCYPDNGADPFQPQLYPVVPNPCFPSTTITWVLPDPAHLALQILNDDCRVVRTLIDQDYFQGLSRIQWDCKDDQGELLPPGDYACVLTAGGFTCAGIIHLQTVP